MRSVYRKGALKRISILSAGTGRYVARIKGCLFSRGTKITVFLPLPYSSLSEHTKEALMLASLQQLVKTAGSVRLGSVPGP